MSTARRPEPFRPPHDPTTCRVCRYLADHPEHDVVHDPATCPGCLNVAGPPDEPQPATIGTLLAAALGIALVGVVFVVALSLIASNTLSVLAR